MNNTPVYGTDDSSEKRTNMKRGLPKYYLENCWFTVDVMKDELRQVDRPDNTISFKDMTYEGKWYQFWYDQQTHNIARHFPGIDDLFALVRLPPLTVLDPEGMAKLSGLNEAEIRGRTDTELLTDPGMLERRRNGELPVIHVGGHDFEIDWNERVLRHVHDSRKIINLRSVPSSSEGKEIDFYFHTGSGERIYLPAAPTRLPENVVLVTLPNEIHLDPLGVARSLGLDDLYFMRKYPLQMRHVARVTQLKDTALPEIVRRNQIEKEIAIGERQKTKSRRAKHIK